MPPISFFDEVYSSRTQSPECSEEVEDCIESKDYISSLLLQAIYLNPDYISVVAC